MTYVAAAPRHRWQIGRYTLGCHGRGNWELSDGCLGAGNQRTPVHAVIALVRWRRQYARMTPAQRIPE